MAAGDHAENWQALRRCAAGGDDRNTWARDSGPLFTFGVRIMRSTTLLPALLASGALALPLPGFAAEAHDYSFPAAAQEITQLYWLAETAAACGWATHDDSARFKLFSLRFLSAHLSGAHRAALRSLVTRSGYEDGVRTAALDGVLQNCTNSRWHAGWVTYKAAADENEQRY
jgi:hypothetical protein